MAADPLVFLHIMKCGGTSVRHALRTGVPGAADPGGTFVLDGRASKLAAGGGVEENRRFRDDLLDYLLRADRPPLIMGHFWYRDRYDEHLGSARFVTMLRDPVERLVSFYKYRRFKDGVDYDIRMDFREYLGTDGADHEGRYYVKAFSGMADVDTDPDQAVEAAVTNLRKFAVVGFLDAGDEFARSVNRLVDGTVTMPWVNESPAPDGFEIPPEDIELAREVCAPNIAVYEALRSP